MQGKVSMVIPCYNKKDYIGATLRSVENQIWDNIELILVNDGSTDGTREVIAQWEPRLRARGYEVVIIDQENQGVCAAVYNGMLRMTGDYFCLIDADDEIMPEYASRMAGWLDEHDDYEWAACNYRRVITDGDKRMVEFPHSAALQDTNRMLENYILRRTITMTWIYMIRARYIKKCGLVEAFCTERRATYEPSIAVPPAAGGGRLKFFDEPLYIYNVFASELFRFAVFEDAIKYYGDYLYLFEWTISKLGFSEKYKQYLICLSRLTHKHQLSNYLNIPGGEMYSRQLAEELALILDDLFTPPPGIDADEILKIGSGVTFEVVRCLILELETPLLKKLKAAKRIIGYGALGKRGGKDLPDLISLSIVPDELWDSAAADGTMMCGLPVTLPDFESLNEADAVIVFPNNSNALAAIRPLFERGSAGVVLYREDMRMIYSLAAFPALLKCEFKH